MSDASANNLINRQALADDELAQACGGVQKVREALADDELALAVGGGDEPPAAVEPDLKATPILF